MRTVVALTRRDFLYCLLPAAASCLTASSVYGGRLEVAGGTSTDLLHDTFNRKETLIMKTLCSTLLAIGLVAAIGLMLATGLGFAAAAASAEELTFDVPAAIVTVHNITQMDADFYPFPLVPKAHHAFLRDDQPLGTSGFVVSGTAEATAALNGFHVMAHTTVGGVAVAEAYMIFIPEDPQHRDQVKVTLKFKADATVGDGEGFASWQVRFGSPGGTWFVRTRDNGTISFIQAPFFSSPPYLEVDGIYRINRENNQSGGGAVVVFRNGQAVEQRLASGSAADDRSIDLDVAPNGGYLIALVAGAGGLNITGSMAVVDPVVVPHPDNPDVVVHMYRAAADETPRSPLADLTAEQLEAEGLDVDTLQALGFFGSSAPDDATPPSTVATSTPDPNANGWNKSPVTVALRATDNAGGSGVKEIHVVLSGATSGQQVAAGDTTSVAISAEGTTTLSYFAVDNAGNQETAKTLSVRIDQTPPTLAGLPAAGCTLWPPDHRLVQIASVAGSDNLSGLAGAPVVTATSSEPASGTGAGDLTPDVVIAGGSIQARAERAGNGPGRVYTISVTANDLAGNTTTVTATCQVPHDRRQTAQP